MKFSAIIIATIATLAFLPVPTKASGPILRAVVTEENEAPFAACAAHEDAISAVYTTTVDEYHQRSLYHCTNSAGTSSGAGHCPEVTLEMVQQTPSYTTNGLLKKWHHDYLYKGPKWSNKGKAYETVKRLCKIYCRVRNVKKD